MNPDSIVSAITRHRIVPVLTVETPEEAVGVCRALRTAGLPVAEITFRTPAAAGCIRAVAEALPEMLIGAGTVLRPEQVDAAKSAGAKFAVAPGLNPEVVRHADAAGLPFIPGVCTPSDVEAAISLGKTLLKFFPAEASGGLAMLNALHGPYGHLGLRFIPTGGITLENMAAYLAHPAVAAVGGTWLAPATAVRARDWAAIERATHESLLRIGV